MKGLKNLVGNLLGYGRCPVTGDTYWSADVVSVPYSQNSGVLVSARALNELPREQIAQVVFERSRGTDFATTLKRYSLEEITEQIPDGCMRLPKI